MDQTDKSPEETAAPGPKAKRLFMRQANMLRVVYALVPLALAGVYLFGWRVLAVLAVCMAAGLATEAVTSRQRNGPISMACFVTCMLYALSLPPTIPLWIAAIGVVVGILFGKEVFGGFGRNFANPAIVGRAFVFICFPVDMTGRYVPAFKGFPGGLGHWDFEGLACMPGYLADSGRSLADAVSQASPMHVAGKFGPEVMQQGASLTDLATGSIGGVFQAGQGAGGILAAGCIGEGCALLIALAAAYLLWTRTANWRLMLGALGGLVAANVLFRTVLGFDAAAQVPPLGITLLGGAAAYVIVFMVTDPVSAPKKRPAQWAYAALIGFLIVFLRWRSNFVEAATFAVLLGNLVGPLLDLGADAWQRRRKTARAGAEGEAK